MAPSSSLLSIFATAIAPIVAIAAVGYLLGSLRDIDVAPLNTVTIYVLVPALIFHSLVSTTIGGETLLRVTVGVVAFLLVMAGLAESVGRLLGETEPAKSALVLTSTFPNSGNYGIPISAFAFGEIGRATAVLFLVPQSIVIYTLGVYIASRGGGERGLGAVSAVLKLPMIYAVLLAVLVRGLGIVPPSESTAMQTLQLVGDASIPIMLLLVGIELAGANHGAALGRVARTNVLKLLAAPLVGLGVVFALGFENTTVARVFVLECATPAAITSLILVIEFSPDVGDLTGPGYVSTAVLTTTLASVPVLTVLIAILKSGVVI